MREAIYKAQRVDGKGWVKGTPYHIEKEGVCFIINNCQSLNLTSEYSLFLGTEVIPETVCQYTGLNDKNGKRIFEGDIIIFGDKKIKQVVEYRKGQYMARQINTKGSYIGLCYCDWEINSELIGNVHDKNEE
jgi:uncharacterized phage protein (TIGR01671 family)